MQLFYLHQVLSGYLLVVLNFTMSWHPRLKNPLPNFQLLTTDPVPLPGMPPPKRPLISSPTTDITWGDIKRLTSRAENTLVNTGTPITPEKILLSLFSYHNHKLCQ